MLLGRSAGDLGHRALIQNVRKGVENSLQMYYHRVSIDSICRDGNDMLSKINVMA